MSEAANAVQSKADTRLPPGALPPEPGSQNAKQGDNLSELASRIAELRVSGNLMTLDTGLFCVFQAPGSPPPDPATGLPGVRVSLAPGPAGRPEAVSISTFRADGWLDGTGALVRIKDGPAQILVTIYQAGRQAAESAPRLQVLRLSGEPAAPAPEAPLASPLASPLAAPPTATDVLAHVQRTGDVGGQIGDWIGLRGSRLWMEGFGLSPRQPIGPEDIEYQGVLGRGWLSPWIEGGKFCGSRGMALPWLGMTVRLKGPAAKAFDCRYSATFVDGSAVGPVPAGQSCEAESLAALEAFQIEIHPRKHPPAGEPRPSGRGAKAKAPARDARR